MLNAEFTMQHKMLQISTGRRVYSQMVGFRSLHPTYHRSSESV